MAKPQQGRDAFHLNHAIDRQACQPDGLRFPGYRCTRICGHSLRRASQSDIEAGLRFCCCYRQCVLPRRSDRCERRKLRKQSDQTGGEYRAVADAHNVMASLAVKSDDNLIAAPVGREHGAAPRGGRNLNHVVNRCADALKGQRSDDEISLQLEIEICRKVLQRTSPAFTIVTAPCRLARRVGCSDRQEPRAVALDVRLDSFAGQRERHEDLLALVLGDAVALRAKAQDGQCRGRRSHRGASSSFRTHWPVSPSGGIAASRQELLS